MSGYDVEYIKIINFYAQNLDEMLGNRRKSRIFDEYRSGLMGYDVPAEHRGKK